ncbi:MAG: biopolymer transporter ExbD [Phycisphaerales bacterium]|nr:biopolymer transporter ExbD [Phycisphaerales bacterium]
MLNVDLTPMIDVVFQLIIFFMFTSQFGELRRTDIDLPKEQGEEETEKQQASMIIDLTLDGQYLFESKPMSLIEIERIAATGVASQPEGEPFDVLVRPDRNAPAVYLDRLLMRLSGVGVRRWKLATVDQEGASQ